MSTPEEIYGVSHGMLSVARHYGGCTFNGAKYEPARKGKK